MEFNTKELKYVHAFISEDKDAIDIDNKRINFTVSSDVVDRSCEVVEAHAVFDAIHRKDQFSRNPICLACHLHRLANGMPPAIGHWDTETAKQRKHHVEMILQYDTEYDLGEKYWIVYKNRTMRAVSIGFRVLDYKVEDRDGVRVYIITKLELFEISCVAVGCNQQALAKLKELGIAALQPATENTKAIDGLKSYINEKLDEFALRIGDQLDEIKDLLITDPDGLASFALGKTGEQSAAGGDGISAEQAITVIKNALADLNS